MIYYTGDIHGSVSEITYFCRQMTLTADDIIVLLGDVGANFFGNEQDEHMKARLQQLGTTFLCIHGNHEMRPATIPTYQIKEWHGGQVWVEPDYPNLLFAKDGEIFDLGGLKHIVIGGAYSVDKYYRLARGFGWWEDEQPGNEIKAYVERQLAENKVDVILSHTCPFKYIPTEMFISGLDQSSVDQSTELWLDEIENATDYTAWFCGHWHTDKRIDKMHFLFHGFESIDQFN